MEKLTSKTGKISPSVLNERIGMLLQEFFDDAEKKIDFSVSYSNEMAVLVAQTEGRSLQLSFQEDPA